MNQEGQDTVPVELTTRLRPTSYYLVPTANLRFSDVEVASQAEGVIRDLTSRRDFVKAVKTLPADDTQLEDQV
jgi:hypothetical protein